MSGLQMTLFLSATTLSWRWLGLVLAVPGHVALAPLRAIGLAFGEIIRNTPILVQLLWVYYVLPIVFTVRIILVAAILIGLSVYQASFISEVYRPGSRPCRKDIARRRRCWGSRRRSPFAVSCCRRRSE